MTPDKVTEDDPVVSNGDATLPETLEGEQIMAEFRCVKCGDNLNVSHGGTTQAVQGLARCGSCEHWTPFLEENNMFRGTDEALMPTRVCPNCKVTTAFRRRWAWPPGGDEVSALDSCTACGLVAYVRGDRSGQEVVDQYPKDIQVPPAELPDLVKTAFAEGLKCYSADAPNGALLMCRRALQETMNNLEAVKGDLPKQLDHLVEERAITPKLRDWADQSRIGGRIAAHGTGGDEWGDPDKVWGDMDDAEIVIEYLKGFFEYVYVLEARIKQKMQGGDQPASPAEPDSSEGLPSANPVS